MAASTCVLSVRWRPRAFSSPPSRAASSSGASRRSAASRPEQPAAELAQDAVVEAGVGQVERQQVLPVDPARTASAAWRSLSPSRNCRSVTSASRQGA